MSGRIEKNFPAHWLTHFCSRLVDSRATALFERLNFRVLSHSKAGSFAYSCRVLLLYVETADEGGAEVPALIISI